MITPKSGERYCSQYSGDVVIEVLDVRDGMVRSLVVQGYTASCTIITDVLEDFGRLWRPFHAH